MYFPKSQIKINLYTPGREFIIDGQLTPYIGYYYQTSNGKRYTGKEIGDGENQLLLALPSSSLNEGNIDNISPNNTITTINTPNEGYMDIVENFSLNILYPNTLPTPNRKTPQSSHLPPTPQNYQEGKFTRYFTKKTNELKYKEISEDTYKKLKNRDEQLAWDLYEPEKIEWEISGNKQIIARNNKQKVIKIEQNRRWYGFSKFLKEDYTKYWRP